MIVVSDTTPLISFLKIGHLDLLQKLFGEVQIPEAVFHELTENKKFFHEAEQIKNCFFIQVVEVKEYQFVNLLRRATGLDLGESEAIILSDSIHADLLLMDEVKGREVAEEMQINIMGTIGLLMAAYQNGLITAKEAEECIRILRASGRHIGERYFQMLLENMKE